MKVLDGIKVVDLSRVLAGPFCGQLLADFGATVIKVESPEGDENRRWPPMSYKGESANFTSVNRGKLGMALNLKNEGARKILRQLAADADVLLHSFLPDTAARLGISLDELRELNPRLVVCTISGYGAFGPLAEKRGYDLMLQAFAGPMSVTGYPGGTPIRSGVSFIDMSTGLSCYAGVVTALMQRQTTGKGTWVRGSLLETAVALMGYHLVGWMQGGNVPIPQGSGSGHLVPYQAFKCADGYMLAGAPNDPAWRRFCDALEWPELSDDPRFLGAVARAEQRDTLIPMLEDRFGRKPVAYWVERFEARSVACSPLHSVQQVMDHEQVIANGMKIQAKEADGSMQDLLGTPFKLAEGGGVAETAAPVLGSATEQVLTEMLGYTEAEVAALRASGAFSL